MLPSAARRKLRLTQGEQLSVDFRDGGIFLRPVAQVRAYRTAKRAVSGLPVMVAAVRPARKVSAAEIARLHAELL
jgi:bifunctional DNA-binding transcriptional regulator/antitoxin component of YhaV-PrlF toxin-antitoxin module